MAHYKRPATYRLSEHARLLISKIADAWKVDKTEMLERLLREQARRMGLEETPESSAKKQANK